MSKVPRTYVMLGLGAVVIIALVVVVMAIRQSDDREGIDIGDASEAAERFAERRKRAGETLAELKCGVKYPYEDEDAILCDAGYEPSGRRYLLHYRKVEGGKRLKRERVVELVVEQASPGESRTLGDLLADVEANAVKRVAITADTVKVRRRNGERYEVGPFANGGSEFMLEILELAPAMRAEGVIVETDRRAEARALGRALLDTR